MSLHATVLFVDLQGSTSVYESLGNAQATKIVTHITQRLSQQAWSGGGRVIKTLGDGVLALFIDSQRAINTAVLMQRTHSKRLSTVLPELGLPIRIGLASGDVEMVSRDCYGDAVNIASRLCDICGPNQIWVNTAAIQGVTEGKGVSFRQLGPIQIRGRNEPCSVYQVEWREEDNTALMTMQATDALAHVQKDGDYLGRNVELSYQDQSRFFHAFDLPAFIGRSNVTEFMVNDLRVSRSHACLEWHHGSIQLMDVSSFGSWLRFEGDMSSEMLLRRDKTILHGKGEIALGASFSDPTAPIVRFSVT